MDKKNGLLNLSSQEEGEISAASSAVSSPVEVKLPESAETKITVFRTAEKSIAERTNPHPPISFEAHSQLVLSLSWDWAGNTIASGSADNTIKIWDGNSLELLRTLEGHSGGVWSLDWNHDGKKLVSGSNDNTIRLWDGLSGQLLKTLIDHSDFVWSVAWSHDDSRIVSGSQDKTIKLWDVISGELLETIKGHSSAVFTVSWSHDDSRVVSGSYDDTIKIWDSSSGTLIRTLTGHSNIVYSVSFSHDDTKIVSGANDKTLRIWNAETGDLLKVLEVSHPGNVECVAWSRDDRKIASCSPYNMTLILWDSLTGQPLNTLPLLSGSRALAWNADNNEIVCGDGKNICIFSVLV
jgi:WD40 repeat protein